MKKRKIRGRGERDGRRERVAPVGVTSCKFVFHKSHSYHTISPSSPSPSLPLGPSFSLRPTGSPSPFGARTHDLCINAEIRRAERNRFRQATTPNDFQRTPARARSRARPCVGADEEERDPPRVAGPSSAAATGTPRRPGARRTRSQRAVPFGRLVDPIILPIKSSVRPPGSARRPAIDRGSSVPRKRHARARLLGCSIPDSADRSAPWAALGGRAFPQAARRSARVSSVSTRECSFFLPPPPPRETQPLLTADHVRDPAKDCPWISGNLRRRLTAAEQPAVVPCRLDAARESRRVSVRTAEDRFSRYRGRRTRTPLGPVRMAAVGKRARSGRSPNGVSPRAIPRNRATSSRRVDWVCAW